MPDKGLRILWKANAPWANTGYGVASNSLLPRLLAMDEVDDIGLFCYYGIQGGKSRQRIGVGRGVTKKHWVDCYPLRANMWGNDVVQDHAADFEADVLITFMDIWVLDADYGNRGFRWCPYMPIDMEPAPPPVIDRMRQAYLPLVYSQFGKRMADEADIESVYLPHGVETAIYKPYGRAHDRDEAKRLIAFEPDHFVIGTVAANKGWPPRKGFDELFEAFRIFHQRHDDARLYMHSLLTSEHEGPNLQEMAQVYGIAKWVNFVDPYRLHSGIDSEMLNMIYNAMDVFCLPSRGEGFGIPIVEAQSAGVPVIVSDSTSMPELVAPGSGWVVPLSDDGQDYMPLKSFQRRVSVGALVDALEEAYKMDRRSRSQAARQFVVDNYDWDMLAERDWRPLMKRLAAEALPRTYSLTA